MLKCVEMYTPQWNVQDFLFAPFIMVSILEWYVLVLRMETAHLSCLICWYMLLFVYLALLALALNACSDLEKTEV
jgi:hypothetical protein